MDWAKYACEWQLLSDLSEKETEFELLIINYLHQKIILVPSHYILKTDLIAPLNLQTSLWNSTLAKYKKLSMMFLHKNDRHLLLELKPSGQKYWTSLGSASVHC